MSIQFIDILQQKKKLDQYADELREVRTKLITHKNILEEVWISEEEDGISDAIERLNREINAITDRMNRLGIDLIVAYEELMEEERRRRGMV